MHCGMRLHYVQQISHIQKNGLYALNRMKYKHPQIQRFKISLYFSARASLLPLTNYSY